MNEEYLRQLLGPHELGPETKAAIAEAIARKLEPLRAAMLAEFQREAPCPDDRPCMEEFCECRHHADLAVAVVAREGGLFAADAFEENKR